MRLVLRLLFALSLALSPCAGARAGQDDTAAEPNGVEVLARVKELGTRKRGLVDDDEFRSLVDG